MDDMKNTVVVYAYRYIWKDLEGKLNVKFITEPQEGHAKFQEALKNNPNVVSCIREYLHEINFEYVGFTEPVKEEEKDEKV